VLAASREPLALAGEQRYLVAPLALPLKEDHADDVAQAPAVALFAERVRAQDPGFAVGDPNATAVAEICRRVDGLPLAIELAAARCGLLSPEEIAERLDAALAVLGRGPRDAPARQQTLRATVQWSHQLLSDDEKACFRRFAVFVGGATVEAVETITGAGLDTLDRLVARSLIVRRRSAQTPTRLLMLETIRAFAADRLRTTDEEAARESHYRYFLALVKRHGTDTALWGADGQEHLAQLDAEIDNLHAALAWAIGQPTAEPALAMCAALGRYWLMRDRYADAVEWIDHALDMPGAGDHPALRIRALSHKTMALWPLGRHAEQSAVVAEVEAAARALADPLILSQALQLRASYLATSAFSRELADVVADEALEWATTAGDDPAKAMAVLSKAMAASTIAELRERVDRAAALLSDAGNAYHLADLLASAAYVALCLASDHDAKEFVDRAIPTTRALENPYLWMLLRGNVGLAALLTGETNAARDAFREELELCRELVVRPFASEGLNGLAAIAVLGNDLDRAARLAGAALEYRYGQPADPVEHRLDATFFEPARRRWGADTWDAAARSGAALSFDDAIVYALDEPRP
jgi:predicted ATPase